MGIFDNITITESPDELNVLPGFIQGPRGRDAFTLQIGEVRAGSPGGSLSVTNSGTPQDQVWDITIPRGDVGPIGPAGAEPGIWGSYVHRTEWNGQIVENHMLRVPVLPELVDACGVGYFDWCMFQASQPNAKNIPDAISSKRYWDAPDVAYSGAPGSVPPAGVYGKPVWAWIDLLKAREAVRNLGDGFHLTTILEDAMVAEWCRRMGIMPHGNNANSNPPRDAEYTTETAILDIPCYQRGQAEATPANWYRCLTGTGPKAWSHNGEWNGIWDLNGNVWEWRDGLLVQASTGYPYVIASYKLAKSKSPYGKASAVGAGYLADETKQWEPGEFAGCWLHTNTTGTLYEISNNTATTLNLVSTGTTPVGGSYMIMRLISDVDITAGSTAGQEIVTMQTHDALKWFNIPASTVSNDTTKKYGNDGFWFNKDALRGAIRGGNFWDGSQAGVFALYVSLAPSSAGYGIGFRAAKCPDA